MLFSLPLTFTPSPFFNPAWPLICSPILWAAVISVTTRSDLNTALSHCNTNYFSKQYLCFPLICLELLNLSHSHPSPPPPSPCSVWIPLNLPLPPALHLANCPRCSGWCTAYPYPQNQPLPPSSPHPRGPCCVGRIAHSTRHVCCLFTLCGGVRLGCVML